MIAQHLQLVCDTYQENQRVNKQVVVLRSREIDTTEEATNPDGQ